MKINPAIFRSTDIRGENDKDLTPETVEMIGRGFGTYLSRKGTGDCLLGRDTRLTSERFSAAFKKGLLSTGCNVFDMGLALSSAIYHARKYYQIDGAAMVTASHNPPHYNGFKLCSGINAIVDSEIQDLKEIILKGNFVQGRGEEKELPQANEIYYQEILKRVSLNRKLKVVLEAGHGTPALFIPQFLEKLGCEVIVLHPEVDSNFPAGVPDPVNPEFRRTCERAVVDNQADIGIVMDADGDRAGFIDEKGKIWMGDMILDLFIRDFLPRNPGAKVVVELKDSEVVVEDTKRLGGVPVFGRTGHALLDHKVFEEKALLCGEMSCHYWITKDWYVFDDAIMAMAHVLRILSETEKTLSQLMAQIPQYPATPEIRFACPEEKKVEIIKKAVNYFKDKCDQAITIDGIRGYKYNGWFLLRKSNTQPLLTARAEAKTEADLEKLKKFIADHLKSYPEINFDWERVYDIT
ncbi:MAG: phosphomannomutase/phosphoglucomutase [Candidatus Pacebacteria bacterium]|nr:phosphomannomutase/phosphoglucomutase [Candidatus Paceibacterota bacterium]